MERIPENTFFLFSLKEKILLFGELSVSVSEMQCFFMLPLLQVCFALAFYQVSGIEIQDGAQLFPHYSLGLCQSKGKIYFFRSNSVT